MIFKKPKFWDLKKPNIYSYILLPFTLPILINNFLLKLKTNQKNKEVKTICVGNIYLGGTGKTPTTIKLYEILKNLNFKVSTAKKFYSSQIDENTILNNKTNFLNAKNRNLVIDQAIKNQKNVIIFDDGLQDKTICYDLELVCFDADSFVGNGFLIPSGPLREKLKSLIKYDGVFLKSENQNNNEQINLIKKYNPKMEIFITSFELNNLSEFNINDNYLIFSGIGNSGNFKKILKKNNFNIVDEIIFPDHHVYKNIEIENIIKKAEDKNSKIITTEKDFVKIPKEYSNNIKYLNLNLKIHDEKKLINFLKKSL
tara:strand:- start:397 stop:1335 length:939 start_codon:yes stop_codon:yes gene_type:complete